VLTRSEQKELREAIAWECLSEIEHSTPEMEDVRLGYVTLQIDRKLWLAARHCPKPPYLNAGDIMPGVVEADPRMTIKEAWAAAEESARDDSV